MMSVSSVLITQVAIIALLALAGYVFNRERSRSGLLLCAALVATALVNLFDLFALTFFGGASFWKNLTVYTEALLPPLWISSSMTYARQSGPWKLSRLQLGAILLSCLLSFVPIFLPLDAIYYAPDFPAERLLFLGDAGFFYYVGIMVCLVFALVNFEVTLANATPESSWKIKIDILGLGVILSVFIFYYSQALLYRSVNMGYMSLRSSLHFTAVVMIFYSLVFRHKNARIQVSRQVAFKSFVLLVFGVYFLLVGFLDEGLRNLGISFHRNITMSLAFLVGIAILIIFLSTRFRREVTVMLHKNFYQHKYDYRTQWLEFTEQLSTSMAGDDLLQRILFAYCNIFGIDGATLFLYEEEKDAYCVTSQYSMDPIPEMISADNSLVRFIKKTGWVVNLKEELADYMAENSEFFARNRISFVIPLYIGERLEGLIMLGRVIKKNEHYIYEDYDLMKTIGRQASSAILHQRLSEQVMHAREMEAIGNVATFVSHDLKNLVSNLSLIVENAPRYIHNPDFQKDMLGSMGNTVVKMQQLIGKLKNLGEVELFSPEKVNLLELITQTVKMIPGAEIKVSGTPETALVDKNEIQKVFFNLLINGIEASEPGEPILVEVGHADMPFVRFTDRGCGMSGSFIRNELFKPFRTTKDQGMGIGLYQCRKIIEAHGCRIEVNSVEGSGTIFTLWFTVPSDMSAGMPVIRSCN